ncbi:CinA family protein [Micromonospora sp. STR1s_5]|nr:CinA family protein [Micromonospora sp. STR1s_5]
MDNAPDPAREYSQDALNQVAARVAARLIDRRESVAVVESSAAGLISAALLAVPGASRFFVGGAVVYTATARESLLGITLSDMAGLRSASEAYAQMLARRVRDRLGASWGLAETGAAGPEGNRYGDPAGHSCLALAGAIEGVTAIRTGLSDRATNMRAFAIEALQRIEGALGP